MTDKLRQAAQRAMNAIISSPNGISDEMFESWMDLRAALAEDAMQRLTDVQQEIEQALEPAGSGFELNPVGYTGFFCGSKNPATSDCFWNCRVLEVAADRFYVEIEDGRKDWIDRTNFTPRAMRRNALAEPEQKREWQGLTEDKLLATFQNLRDESHTIQGASDDYKQGREMGIQICINELLRGEK